MLAEASLARGQFADAIQMLRDEVAKRPDDPRLRSALAGCLSRVEGTLAAASAVSEGQLAAGDSIEDLESAEAVGRFFCVANGPEHDDDLREALSRFDNVTVTEGRMGDGFYEAVVQTLVGAV